MANVYDQFFAPQPAGSPPGNPYDTLFHGSVVDEQEQDVISRVNNPSVESPRNFGFVGFPATIANEFARSITSIPHDIGATLLEAGELSQSMQGSSAADVAMMSLAKRIAASEERKSRENFTSWDGLKAKLGGMFELPRMLIGVEKDVILNAISDGSVPKILVNSGNAIMRDNEAATKLLHGDQKAGFASDLGSGLGSVFKSIGAAYIAKTPYAAGAYMTWNVNSNDYLEARDADLKAGKPPDPEKWAMTAGLSAVGQGKIEGIGMGIFQRIASTSGFFKKVLFRASEQAAEETAQGGVEETVKEIAGVRDTPFSEKLHSILYQGALGFIVGAPVSAVYTHMENTAKGYGIDPAEIKRQMDALVKNKDDVVEGAAELLNREATGITKDEPSQAEAQKVIKQVIADKEAVDTATAEGTTQDPKIAAKILMKSANEDTAAAIKALPEGFTMEQLREATGGQRSLETGVPSIKSPSDITEFGTQAEPSQETTLPEPSGIFSSAAMTPKSEILTGLVKNSGIKNTPSNPIIYQKSDSANDLVAKAESLEPQLNQYLAALTGGIPGIRLINTRTTSADSVKSKLKSGNKASQISDYLGARFVADSRKSVQSLVSRIGQDAKITAVHDFLDIPKDDGYRATHIQVATNDGFTYEIQIIPKPIADIYDEARKIYTKWKDFRGAIPKEMAREYLNDMERSRALFDKAMERFDSVVDGKHDESDYAKIAEQVESGTLGDDTRHILSDAVKIGGDAFVPVSTRLGKIDQKIKHAVRKFLFQNGLYSHQDKKAIKPFIEKVSEMSEADYRILDFALKNRDQTKINELVEKYKITKEFNNVRKILDDLYAEAQEVGLDMNYLSDYFPRIVKRNKVLEYMAAMRGREEWTEIEAALEAADPQQVFTQEEQVEFVDNFLRGFSANRVMLAKGGFTKQRAVDYVTPEFNQFYESSMPALIQYVDAVRHGIEARRLFGKGNADASIGTYVASLVNEGSVKQYQVEELKKILKAIVEPQGTRGVVSWAKNVTYIYVMGSPVSAITQVQDLGFSLAFNGYYRTGKALTKAILGKSEITQKDIGLDNILQEFSDESRAGNAVRKVFKAIGFSYIDNIGSETYMNAALDRLRSENKKNRKSFNKEMDIIFGAEAGKVKEDLAAGTMNENVQYLAYSELLDVQPKALSEMPVYYLNGGNGRIFYMLKSYTIKQIDTYRRKVFDEIASGEPERMIKGTQNLIRLSVALMLMGMTADALKDLLLGRDIEPDELVLDNLLKLTGITKYQIYKSRQEGVMQTFWKTLFVPPIGAPIDDAIKDISKISTGDRDITEAETAKGVPVIGKLYYWWFGGGLEKENSKKSPWPSDKKSNSKSPWPKQ